MADVANDLTTENYGENGFWSTGAVQRRFKRTSVTQDFYTLQETNIAPEMAQVLRISRTGGPIQVHSGGNWQVLYSASEVY